MYYFLFHILLLFFGEFSDFVRECLRMKLETVWASETNEFFEFSKPSGKQNRKWDNKKKNLLVLFGYEKYQKLLCIIKTFSRKDPWSDDEEGTNIDHTNRISRIPDTEIDRSSSCYIIFEIEGFEIREKNEECPAHIKCLTRSFPPWIIKHLISSMTDNVGCYREKHSNNRWNKGREKKDKHKERKELDEDSEYCREQECIYGKILKDEEAYEE